MRRLAVVVLVLFGLVAGLVAAEVALRIALDAKPSRRAHIVSDPVLHHRHPPNVTATVRGVPFVTNSLGLHDRELTREKPAGVRRLLMLGDSFTEGGGLALSDTVAKRTEVMLNGCGDGARWEVVNGGVGSYSPILEYLFFREVGRTLAPDLVVVNVDMTDLHDDTVRTAVARLDGQGLPLAVLPDARREGAVLLPPVRWVVAEGVMGTIEPSLNQFAAYQALRKSGVGRRIFGDVRLTPERLETLGLAGDVRFDAVAATRDAERPDHAEAWRRTERYLVGLRDAVRAAGAGFAVVVYPHPHQVSADASPIGRRRVGAGPGLYTSERPFQKYEAMGARGGFRVVSLLTLFRERARTGPPLFWDDDMHHTPRGAAVFAEGIVAGLRTHGLVACGDAGAATPRRAGYIGSNGYSGRGRLR